jgi:hypothetical protein
LTFTGAVRTWYQVVPWDHGLDEVLHPDYLNSNYLAFREGDRVELQASDLSWMVAFVIVSVNRNARTVRHAAEGASDVSHRVLSA